MTRNIQHRPNRRSFKPSCTLYFTFDRGRAGRQRWSRPTRNVSHRLPFSRLGYHVITKDTRKVQTSGSRSCPRFFHESLSNFAEVFPHRLQPAASIRRDVSVRLTDNRTLDTYSPKSPRPNQLATWRTHFVTVPQFLYTKLSQQPNENSLFLRP